MKFQSNWYLEKIKNCKGGYNGKLRVYGFQYLQSLLSCGFSNPDSSIRWTALSEVWEVYYYGTYRMTEKTLRKLEASKKMQKLKRLAETYGNTLVRLKKEDEL